MNSVSNEYISIYILNLESKIFVQIPVYLKKTSERKINSPKLLYFPQFKDSTFLISVRCFSVCFYVDKLVFYLVALVCSGAGEKCGEWSRQCVSLTHQANRW